MDNFIGDLGILFTVALIVLYIMWDRLFPR